MCHHFDKKTEVSASELDRPVLLLQLNYESTCFISQRIESQVGKFSQAAFCPFPISTIYYGLCCLSSSASRNIILQLKLFPFRQISL